MIGRAAGLVGLCLGAGQAQACGTQIMGCSFDNGAKTVQICLSDENVTYAYGPTGGPAELSITEPVATIDYLPWPGVGSSIWETLTFETGSYRYALTAGFDRNPNRDAGYGGISITENAKEIGYLTCDPGSIDWTYGNQLAKAKRDLGLCWGGTSDPQWVACP